MKDEHDNIKHSTYVACSDCALDEICKPIPIGTDKPLSYILDNMERRSPLIQGDILYQSETPLESIYAVTSGTFKLTRHTSGKAKQVVGFRFPGELLGDEALAFRQHLFTAEALEDSSVCKIKLCDIDNISKHIPSFQHSLFTLVSHQCAAMHQQFAAYVAKNTSEQKVAAFLVNTTERSGSSNNISTKVKLPMSRTDIANFLGIRHETLSRILSKFQTMELIQIRGKFVYLPKPEELSAIV